MEVKTLYLTAGSRKRIRPQEDLARIEIFCLCFSLAIAKVENSDKTLTTRSGHNKRTEDY